MMWQILGEKFCNGMGLLGQSFTRCQNSIQHFDSVWVLEPIYTQRFPFRINTTTRREILKQNLHNDVLFSIKNLTHCLLWNEKFTSCQNFESKVYIVSACGRDEWFYILNQKFMICQNSFQNIYNEWDFETKFSKRVRL